jgi:protein-disulfide isomerase
MEEEKKSDDTSSKDETKPKASKNKKIKNLTAAAILLAGLFLGSLFVDVAQMVRGKGFSQRVLKNTDVFALDGKTWVAYKDPIVRVRVLTEEGCEECNPEEALVWLGRVIPTIVPEKVDINSSDGKSIAQKYEVKSIPAYIFAEEIDKTDFFTQAAPIFDKKSDSYLLQTAQLGLPVGKYVETPAIADDDVQIGPKDAKVKLIEFSDFQCPYCRAFQVNTIQRILKEYEGKILFVFKNLPLTDIHPQAENAALAAQCANEQGKFEAYAGKLFDEQNDWGKTDGTQKFKTYAAQLGLKTTDFNKCLDDKKYQDKIDRDKQEADKFGISGTPSVFINGQFKGGAVAYEDIKKVIDEELAK